jgi:hypothetical protein
MLTYFLKQISIGAQSKNSSEWWTQFNNLKMDNMGDQDTTNRCLGCQAFITTILYCVKYFNFSQYLHHPLDVFLPSSWWYHWIKIFIDFSHS